MSSEEKKKPAYEVRIGTVKAAIWGKTTASGRIRYDVNVTRLFKRKNGTSWEYSDYFNRDEIPVLIKVLDQAHSWMLAQKGNAAPDETQTAAA